MQLAREGAGERAEKILESPEPGGHVLRDGERPKKAEPFPGIQANPHASDLTLQGQNEWLSQQSSQDSAVLSSSAQRALKSK